MVLETKQALPKTQNLNTSKINLTLGEIMDVAITRISSKGQVIIPIEMRKGLNEGDKLLIIQNDDQLVMKKASDLDKNVAEDIKFAKKTEEAWKRIECGKGIKMDFDEFIKEMKKW